MRVISGKLRGQKLISPPNPKTTRPTTDRVKETLFQILKNKDALKDATVLDLFAGSGALGIESISRGALKSVLVDNNFQANRAILHNVNLLKLLSYTDVILKDYNQFLRTSKYQFDVVFLDPPYTFENDELIKIVQTLKANNQLIKNALIVIERDSKSKQFDSIEGFAEVYEKVLGSTKLLILEFLN